MKVELHSNGKTQIQLTGETPIQSLVLQTMLEAAEKGTAVILMEGPCVEGKTSVLVSMEV